ncbi:MAG: DUF6091 family protein [Fluviicoccus sp.]|uniref:putative solute-binding protein n=1 Tax=Fluviicoccus sp. TaxID=2003552 RepID=UPI00271ABB9A|nr:putative solute-binding protein [Fluviicoccus sp.]MDO8330788.1 DUF6091 family protein [Fluviicoccus sp.]
MYSRLKKNLLTACQLGMLLAGSQAFAADLLPLAKDIKPGAQGLPTAFTKPLKMSICFFDMQGRNGEYYGRAQDLALIAKRWNIEATLKVFTEEEDAVKAFKAGQCEGAVMSTLRSREFNRFMGSLDAPGAIPTYQHMRVVLKTLLDKKIEPYTITGSYQTIGAYPLGAQYLFVRDGSMKTLDGMNGKKVAILNWDKSLNTLVGKMGATAVPESLSGFAKPFNKGEADAILSPAVAYHPFQLGQGMGEKGGIFKSPMGQLSAVLVINRDLISKKTDDVDARVAAFRSMSAQFLEDLLNQFFISIDHQDKDIPGKYWIEQDAAQLKAVEDFLNSTRIQMTKDGFYDARMMKILKKVRCTLDTKLSECAQTDE